ncbi:nitrilotriacetate monooxygenase component B [Aspergillus sclerotioniger CBS 115572]|uniref:Nitrilotriacetate monooxygenase component B n=1 Tax=Aspergillus sclerotioniger CBS 115572 TaxID=1450535 RepID=A0A317VAI5_9EURO|nr:nitrilotriacetate monooxygenase component B [Aspergillus sclerotioniger CBS 115572]PWY68950.1 nitrilotriacetate monooxygenase component B [Aspergillus sclerotioniger CBS 115572]
MATVAKSIPRLTGRSFLKRTSNISIRMNSSSAAEAAAKATYKIVSNHHDFPEIEAKRPPFDHSNPPIKVTQSPYPDWNYGQGVPNHTSTAHHEIDPYATDRPMINNYRLLVSGIAPRPIGFISTVSGDGKTENLAPFSYFQVVDHDPPTFIVGFSSRPGPVKDTYRNLKETGECVINTVSEGMIEAVNATSIDAPYGVSEWEISGLCKAPSSTVKPARVKESVFSVEGKVVDIKDFEGHRPGMSAPAVVLIQATRFWVQEGAADKDFSHIDLEKLRPVAQLGGVAYGRITETFERPRKRWEDEVEKSELLTGLERRNQEQ